MEKVGLKYEAKQFDQNLTSLYNLSVIIGTDRLFYLISNAEEQVLGLNTYRRTEQTPLIIQNILADDPLLRLPYHQTSVGVLSNYNTIVPSILFTEDKANLFLQSSMNIPFEHEVFTDYSNTLGWYNIYAVDLQTKRLLEQYFPNSIVRHIASTYIIALQKQEKTDKKQVYIQVYERNFHLFVLDQEGQLMMHNIFEYKTPEDFLYYVLLVYKQLALFPESIPLYISGDLLEESNIYRLLKRYIQHVLFMPNVFYYRFEEDFTNINTHTLSDLYSLKYADNRW